MSKKEEVYLAEHLADLADTFLECRELRHSWKRQGKYTEIKGSKNLVARSLKCSRCEATRTDVLNVQTFDRVGSHYDYPDGYTIAGNTLRGGAAKLVRREAWSRFS
jgi:hypothetical protein